MEQESFKLNIDKNPDLKSMDEILGVSKDRFSDIAVTVSRSMAKVRTVKDYGMMEAVADTSEICKNKEELFLSSYLVGCFMGRTLSDSPIGAIIDILSGMGELLVEQESRVEEDKNS